MLRDLCACDSPANPQALSILQDPEAHSPAFLHAVVDQDRPVGDTRMFPEHTHNLYRIVLLR